MLSEAQVELLIAMNRPVNTHVRGDAVWIGHHQYDLRDLFALRAAGLVHSAEITKGARGVSRFHLNDKGISEAQRRNTIKQVAGAADSTPRRTDESTATVSPTRTT
jgi:hypothetical protein